nr:hypothetical protein [Tanacetum cinerariifolium]
MANEPNEVRDAIIRRIRTEQEKEYQLVNNLLGEINRYMLQKLGRVEEETRMVNTRTDADLSAAVQNALRAMLPRIREEIREEFRTGSGSSNAGGNPPPVTIHTWLERFNKQKPHSFEKATAPVDAENWISHMEKIFDVMAAGTEEEQAKNFQWGLRRSTLNHLMCMSYMDVAQVANAARNYEILHERDDVDTERPDKRRPLRRVVTGATVIITTVMDLTGMVAMTTDAENWISHMEKIFDVMGCEAAFKTILAVYKFEGDALAWWKAYKQAKGGDVWLITVTWAEFKELFFLQLFPRAEQERLKREAAAGTTEEQAKNFQWGLRKSTLNHLMCIPFTDVAQVANAARNYEIIHERDDDGTERPDKRQKSDRRGGGDNHRSNNNYSGNNNRSSGNGRDQRNRGQQSNRPANSGFQQSRSPSEGYSYAVCTTCGRRHPEECRRAAGTYFKCGQTGHLQKDCKKNIAASTSSQADKKPGALGRVFAITEVMLLRPQVPSPVYYLSMDMQCLCYLIRVLHIL